MNVDTRTNAYARVYRFWNNSCRTRVENPTAGEGNPEKITFTHAHQNQQRKQKEYSHGEMSGRDIEDVQTIVVDVFVVSGKGGLVVMTVMVITTLMSFEMS